VFEYHVDYSIGYFVFHRCSVMFCRLFGFVRSCIVSVSIELFLISIVAS